MEGEAKAVGAAVVALFLVVAADAAEKAGEEGLVEAGGEVV